MKTLRSWANKNNVIVSRHAHARCVSNDAPNQAELFRLDDYFVSAVAAGTIWLTRRASRTAAENMIRGNIRNACVGMSIIQIDSWKDTLSEFSRDCAEEFQMELEAEERDAERRKE